MGHSWVAWRISAVATLIMCLAGMRSAIAQTIVPDETLGEGRSRVIENASFNGQPLTLDINGVARPIDVILDGVRRGNNLFHSFTEFNAASNRATYFVSPDRQVQNILARVTGRNQSQILGVLGIIQTENGQLERSQANLFLINPNGILFGSNSRLDIGGSFVATTADALQFGESKFSATNPEPIADVLRIIPSAFLFSQVRNNAIIVNSSIPAPDGSFGLRAADRQALILLGGEVKIDGGQITVAGGRIEIGAVQDDARIGLAPNGKLEFPGTVLRGDVSLVNNALLDVALDDRGDIGITAQNIVLSNESALRAGIRSGFGSTASRSGDISLDVTNNIQLRQSSNIQNFVAPNAIGNSGNVVINARGSLLVTDGSQISSSTFGEGNSGETKITTENSVLIQGRSLNSAFPSAIFSNVEQNAKGTSGGMLVSSGAIEVLDGALLDSSTRGKGNAGSLRMIARDRILFRGTSANGSFSSGIDSGVAKTAEGNGGSVDLQARVIEILKGAQLANNTQGIGDAGTVQIDAKDRLTIRGEADQSRVDVTGIGGRAFSSIISGVIEQGRGNGSTLKITTGTLELLDSGSLVANTEGKGNAGNIIVNARDRVIASGTGTSSNPSGMYSSVTATGQGNGGRIEIDANTVDILNGAQLSAIVYGQGNAGAVKINANDKITLVGRASTFNSSSAIATRIERRGIGQGGSIELSGRVLEMREGAQVTTSTFGEGIAGNIKITTRESISLNGRSLDGRNAPTAIFSSIESEGKGNAGNIQIETGLLEISGGAFLTSTTNGIGNAGKLDILARERITFIGTDRTGRNSSGISSDVAAMGRGDGGNIKVAAPILELFKGAQITSGVSGEGKAGNITISTPRRTTIEGASDQEVLIEGKVYRAPSLIFSGVASSGKGSGGEIQIDAGNVTMTRGGGISTSSDGVGNAGNVTITAQDQILLADENPDRTTPSVIISSITSNGRGNGGKITLNARKIQLLDGGQIAALSEGRGNAGRIQLTALDSIKLQGSTPTRRSGSSINTVIKPTGIGTGGNIEIEARNLELLDGAQISTSVFGEGQAGNVIIKTQDQVLLNGINQNGFSPSAVFSNVETRGKGNGGNIEITTRRLDLLNGGSLFADTRSQGNAGDILVRAAEEVRLERGGIFSGATQGGRGQAGKIEVFSRNLTLNQSRIDVESFAVDGGNIVLNLSNLLLLRNNSGISATAGIAQADGNGGNININSRFIVAIPKENSDITANAFRGNGGKVILNTERGILGLEVRSRQSSLSDITASSAQGAIGIVTLNAPSTEALQNSLNQLAQDPIDTNTLLANSCIVRNQQNGSFYITGTGGLPINPGEISTYATGTAQSTWKLGDEIVEPQAVYQLPNGALVLSRECK